MRTEAEIRAKIALIEEQYQEYEELYHDAWIGREEYYYAIERIDAEIDLLKWVLDD